MAEDDSLSRELLTDLLTSLGHDVCAQANGQKAWDAFRNEDFRVVVSDWMMPEMDGLGLCRKIRTMTETTGRYAYFIMLTSNVGREQTKTAMDSGVDDFLEKPLRKVEIEMRLRVANRILGFTTQIHELEELLPMCSYCKNVRDEDDYWQAVEGYLHSRTNASVSHGVCPDCEERIVRPQFDNLIKKAS